jgi:MFS family permease
MSDTQPGRLGWLIVAMLFTFMLLNFASKVVLGLAAVPIMREMHLTHEQFGTLSASFFYLFSLSCLVVGFMVNRIRTTLVIGAMSFLWSICQLLAIGNIGYGFLLFTRVALGAGEGPAFPVGLHAVYKWFPSDRRTLPAAIISQGSSVGVVMALPLLNILVVNLSWHWAFGVIGLLTLVWTAAWLLIGREGPLEDRQAEGAQGLQRVPYRKLLLNPTLLAAWLCGFGGYWGVALLVSWFTPYIVEGLGFSQREAGFMSTAPWAASIFIAIICSMLSERLVKRGVSRRLALGVFGGGMVAMGGAALIVAPLIDAPLLAFALVVLGLSLPSVIYAMQPAIAAELVPVSQRGAILAIGTAIWSTSGMIAPVVMGKLIDIGHASAQGYEQGFVVAGVIALVAGTVGAFFINPEKAAAQLKNRMNDNIESGRPRVVPVASGGRNA